MKFHNHTIANAGNKTVLSVNATDRMKRPVRLKLVVEQADTLAEVPMITMDRAELGDFMSQMANIAWTEFKWRPAGLAATLAHLVTNFKMPAAK